MTLGLGVKAKKHPSGSRHRLLVFYAPKACAVGARLLARRKQKASCMVTPSGSSPQHLARPRAASVSLF